MICVILIEYFEILVFVWNEQKIKIRFTTRDINLLIYWHIYLSKFFTEVDKFKLNTQLVGAGFIYIYRLFTSLKFTL